MAAPTATLSPARTTPARRFFSAKYARWLIMGPAALFVFVATVYFLLLAGPL